MGTVALKLLLIFFMGIVPLLFGILPIKILGYLIRRNGHSHSVRTLISVFTCFAGGVILGVSLIELFPEAREGIAELGESESFYESYPFVELFVGVGFLLVYFVEEFMTILLGHSHHDHIDEIYAAKAKRDQRHGIENAAMSNDVISDAGDSTRNSFHAKHGYNDAAITVTGPQSYESMAPRRLEVLSSGLEVSVVAAPNTDSDFGSGIGSGKTGLGSPASSSSSSDSVPRADEEFGSSTQITHAKHRQGCLEAANGGHRSEIADEQNSEACNGVIDDSASEEERRKAVIGAITLVIALFVHTSLEGFAFGIQKDVIGVGSLFFGIIVHKVLVFFSVGINLTQALPRSPRIVIALIILLASFSPIGAVIGIIVEGAEMNGNVKGAVSTILICISIGTFLYIALFEILAPERHKPVHKLLQWFGCALGFAVMSVVLSLAGHNHVTGYHGHSHDHANETM